MQIFWPENNYQDSAMALDDKRLNKQILELGQILSTALWIEDCGIAETLTALKCIYLPTHENHPVVKNCTKYYTEAIEYLEVLMDEYYYRFSKFHTVRRMLFEFKSYDFLFKKYYKLPFQNHTTNHKHIKDVNAAYRQCLIEKWKSETPKWTNRKAPAWAEISCN